jgi:hypothetical protein
MEATAAATTELEALRERRNLLAITKECAELEAETSRLQRVALAESALSNLVDPRIWRTAGFGAPLSSSTTAGERNARDDGRNLPVIRTESDLTEIRGGARVLLDTNEFAIGAAGALCDYTIGNGYTYSATAKKGYDAKELAAAINEIVDEFHDTTNFRMFREREIFDMSLRDGEAFVRVHDLGAGRADLRIVLPEYVTENGCNASIEEWLGLADDGEIHSWTFGVHTLERDVQRELGYHIAWNASSTDEEYAPAGEVEHIKRNVDSTVKRGISDFYPVEKRFTGVAGLTDNVVAGAKVQAAIPYILEFVEGTTISQAQTLQSQSADFQYNQPTPAGYKSVTVQERAPGTVLGVPKGQQYKPGPMGADRGPLFLEVVQGGLRAAGVRWRMPEHIISGNAANNNYASILEAGSPFVKKIEFEQARYAFHFVAVTWRAIKIAFDAGRLNRFGATWEQIRRMIMITAVPPNVATRDKDQETARRKILNEEGIMSDDTWASEEGLDIDEERSKGASRRVAVSPFGQPQSQAQSPTISQPVAESASPWSNWP